MHAGLAYVTPNSFSSSLRVKLTKLPNIYNDLLYILDIYKYYQQIFIEWYIHFHAILYYTTIIVIFIK